MRKEKFLQIMQRFCILVSIGIVALFVINLLACKTIETNIVKQTTVGDITYSYIDIDPLVIVKTWGEPIVRVQLNRFMFEVYFRNPDESCDIQFATLIVLPGGIVAYSYMIDGNINVCEFNPETNAYESGWASLSEKDKQKWYDDYRIYFGLGSL